MKAPTTEARVPPHSTEAEQGVIAALLGDNSSFDVVGQLVAASDFYSHEHRLLFAVIERLILANQPADVVTTCAELGGDLEGVGGQEYVSALSWSPPSSSQVRKYADIVRDRSLARQLIAAARDAESIAWDAAPARDKLDRIAAKFAVLERTGQAKQPTQLSDLLIRRIDRLTDIAEGGLPPGWPTRLPTLDDMLNGGLRPGHVYVLAARPGVGKSSFAQHLALTLAEQDLPVLFLSQEMPNAEVTDRAISNLSRVEYGALQTARLNEGEWSRVADAVARASRLPLLIDDQPALTLGDIRAKARSVRGLRVLLIDYLQLCSGNGDNRNGEIEAISRGIKALAKELDIAVINLSQLNRAVETRSNKRPQLADLRDSGAIEQDADVVMFLWPVRELGARQIIGLAVEKNRQGRRGAFGLDFDGSIQGWVESTASIEPPTRTERRGGGFE